MQMFRFSTAMFLLAILHVGFAFIPSRSLVQTVPGQDDMTLRRRPLFLSHDLTTRMGARPFGIHGVLFAEGSSSSNESDDDDDDDNDDSTKKSSSNKAKRKKGSPSDASPKAENKKPSKEELVKQIGEQMRKKKAEAAAKGVAAAGIAAGVASQAASSTDPSQQQQQQQGPNFLDTINPFKAGQNLRKTLDSALTSISKPSSERKSIYLDELLDMQSSPYSNTGSALDSVYDEDYVPEVLVVGATGEVGRLVVRRLLQEGLRVRVLVRDLYSKTLNMLGTGVTYCQGDLSNMDSLEYALTDVDKIVFCASAPKPDEDAFQEKFQDFMKENLQDRGADDQASTAARQAVAETDLEWEQLDSIVQVRARLAEQVDCVGMQNLVRAYQHVRHADYGTAQSAKRTLFRYRRMDDFNLFAIDDQDDQDDDDDDDDKLGVKEVDDLYAAFDEDDDEEDDEDDLYEDTYAKDEYAVTTATRRDGSARVQSQWVRNKFDHGVFVGRIPKELRTMSTGGQAAIISVRFRSRSDPDRGIDLGPAFYGFIVRACSDGGVYEAFIRTGAYYEDGIEYVAEFSTETKPTGKNKSSNKFTTVRLPFFGFKPVRRRDGVSSEEIDESVPVFRGADIRHIGFRYRSSNNQMKSQLEEATDGMASFYLALDYVKLYRAQPEPEFVYLSDARIPPVVRNGMVRHEARQLVSLSEKISSGNKNAQLNGEGAITLLDEKALKVASEDTSSRTAEETYFKYRGEEILKRSGLSYAILRVSGYNESPTGEFEAVDLKASNEEVGLVSRADAAEVCVSALLQPSALNKCVYVSKKRQKTRQEEEEDMSVKFSSVPEDVTA